MGAWAGQGPLRRHVHHQGRGAKGGHPPEELEAAAEVNFDRREGITGAHTKVRGTVPGLPLGEFTAMTDEAKGGCPASKALAGAGITLDAWLS